MQITTDGHSGIYSLDIRDYGAIILHTNEKSIERYNYSSVVGRLCTRKKNLHFRNKTMAKYGNITEMKKTKIKFPLYGEKTSKKKPLEDNVGIYSCDDGHAWRGK